MEKILDEMLPIMDVEHDCIVSKMGDVTVAFKVELPEIFTLSDQEYEAFHQSWVKAIKVLPKYSVLHNQRIGKQQARYIPHCLKDQSFLKKP